MLTRHRRPINSRNNTLAVVHLTCIRKVLRIDSWFHLTTIFPTNIASSIFYTRCTSLFKCGRWPTLSARSDDENYDVRTIPHQFLQGIYSPFLTIVCIINALKADRAHLKVVKDYHVYISRTGKVPNIYDVISYIMTSSPWRSLFAWRVTFNHFHFSKENCSIILLHVPCELLNVFCLMVQFIILRLRNNLLNY